MCAHEIVLATLRNTGTPKSTFNIIHRPEPVTGDNDDRQVQQQVESSYLLTQDEFIGSPGARTVVRLFSTSETKRLYICNDFRN